MPMLSQRIRDDSHLWYWIGIMSRASAYVCRGISVVAGMGKGSGRELEREAHASVCVQPECVRMCGVRSMYCRMTILLYGEELNGTMATQPEGIGWFCWYSFLL